MEYDLVSPLNPAPPGGHGKGPRSPLAAWALRPNSCVIPECGLQIDPSRLMCRHDWRLVPKELQDRIWTTWRSGRPQVPSEHRAAVSDAIAAVLACRHHDPVDNASFSRRTWSR